MSTTTERPGLGRRARTHPRARARLGAGLAAAGCVLALAAPAAAQSRPPADARSPLGPNVLVVNPDMPVEQIQAAVKEVTAKQVDAEMGTGRYALLFEPGTYGTAEHPLQIQVGYYTEVAGLGASPSDVTIHGHVDVYNRCLDTDADGNPSNCIALDNFWRSVSNLTIDVAGGSNDCRQSADFWAVSQAAPMRRVDLRGGNLSLMDYCTAGPQYASGGFIADSRTQFVINGSQQQFLVRDSSIGGWSNGVWNQVFSGVEGAPAQSFPDPPYTTLDKTPVSREKPFLTKDEHGWAVFVPAPRTESRGTTWADGATAGRSIPLSDFYVAHPGDSVQGINSELARGKNLLLTPGVYDVDRSIAVKRPDTVVLGLGLATLTAVHGAVPLTVADVKGVDIAGITIDAGTVNSPALLRVGTQHAANGTARQHNGWSDPADPTALQDVFFRIGGPHVGKATVALEVNADHVVLDDIWAWRADHGVPGSVGWNVNTSDTGVVVNGDDVTATGLFSEHFQKYNVIWDGERGKTIFFQNELPYDAPDQAAWQHDGVPGYAAYKVSDWVRTHELWGGGSYIYTNVDPSLHAARGFEVPVTPGVRLHDLLTVSLNHAGTIDHVVNDTGDAVTPDQDAHPATVVSYP
ncbi:MAG: adenylyl cyclase [Motilibacteraceae bacterium]